MSNENREYFKRALAEAIEMKERDFEKEIDNTETAECSTRHKKRVNRIIRERVGGTKYRFPRLIIFTRE